MRQKLHILNTQRLGCDRQYRLRHAYKPVPQIVAVPAMPIGNSDNSQVGDWVVAIGNPYNFDYLVTAGVLSAKERSISINDPQGVKNYQHLIQTDTAINPGNSGGPLLNINGEVIGINTAINANAQGMGFSVPASTISSVLDKLKNNQTIGNG
jgi:S1-C subfamily serine protease